MSATGLGAGATTYQMQFTQDSLTGINVGDRITGLTFRLTSSFPSLSSSDFYYNDYEIYLAEAVNSVSTMSNTFADNMSNSLQVRDNSLSFDVGAFQGGATNPNTNPFGSVINFDTPYTYQGGDLVVFVRHTDRVGGSPLMYTDGIGASTVPNGYGTDFRALSGNGFDASSVTHLGYNVILPITQFTVEQAQAVPEPVTILGTLASLGFGLVLKKKKGNNEELKV